MTDRRELLRRWVEGLWRSKVGIVEREPFPYTIDLEDLRPPPPEDAALSRFLQRARGPR